MIQFSYYGRDTAGQGVTGTLEAASPGHVADWLHNTGITPVVIEPVVHTLTLREVLARLLGQERISRIELMMFSRQMYTLARSGIPLLRALRSLETSSHGAPMRQLMRELYESLDAGLELSQAMARRSDAFDNFYVSMVRVGESTGELEEVFQSLFKHLEFQKFMNEQVRAALRYPTFVILAMCVAIGVINMVVIPAFAKVFENMHTELPLMTKLLLGSSRFMLAWWPAVLAGGVGLTVAWRSYIGRPAGRLAWDRTKLNLPVAGALVRKGVLSQAARTLALVFRSGVPIVQGLTLTAQVVENAFVSRALEQMRSTVERGDSLLAASSRAGIFTPVVLQMIMVGEESGSLAEMLDEIGQMYQREVEYEMKTLSQRIEPLLIVALGGMVLVLALGVFLPMWEMGGGALK
jgi:MSHA biogenesis protein MshG